MVVLDAAVLVVTTLVVLVLMVQRSFMLIRVTSKQVASILSVLVVLLAAPVVDAVTVDQVVVSVDAYLMSKDLV